MADIIPRPILRAVYRLMLRLEVRGTENLARIGPRTVVVANHVGFLDPPLVAAIVGRTLFAVDRTIAGLGWMQPILRFGLTSTVDPERPIGVRRLIAAARDGMPVTIFPEGRLTVTGGRMKIYDGAAFVAERADAAVLPIHIDGMEDSRFTRLGPGLTRRLFRPRITVTVGAPQRLDLAGLPPGKLRRTAGTARLAAAMAEHALAATLTDCTIPAALREAARRHGGSRIAAQERLFARLGLRDLIRRMARAAGALSHLAPPGGIVAVALPNDLASLIAILGLIAVGRVPCFIEGADSDALAVADRAGAAAILTSRQSPLLAGLQRLSDGPPVTLIEAIDLDRGGNGAVRDEPTDPDQPAVMLPGKAGGLAVLTHRNLLANIAQIRAVLDIGRGDRSFAFLPYGHPLGFGPAILLPLIAGGSAYLHGGPSSARMLAEFIYVSNPTVLFAPVEMVARIGAAAKPQDLRSLRYVFAAGGPAGPELRERFMARFGIRILDCLATPETQIAAIGRPADPRAGTFGTLLPGIEARTVPSAGLAGDGRLELRGPNIAIGAGGEAADGWHDIGLRGRIEEGCVLPVEKTRAAPLRAAG